MGNWHPSIVCYENSEQTSDQETTTPIIIKWLKHRSMTCIESVLHTRHDAETEKKGNFLQLFLRSMMPLRSPSTLLITRMITDRIRLHSVLLPLLVCFAFYGNYRRGPKNLFSWFRSDWPRCFLVVWAPNCCMFAHQLTMFRVQIYQQWVCLKWFLNEGKKIYWDLAWEIKRDIKEVPGTSGFNWIKK